MSGGAPRPWLDLERVICRASELEGTGTRAFTIGGGDWPLRGFVVRSGTALRAYVNCCPHAGHPLDLIPGRFLTADGSLILCSSHGALFEKATGLCVAGPCAGRTLVAVGLQLQDEFVLLAEDVDVDALRESRAP